MRLSSVAFISFLGFLLPVAHCQAISGVETISITAAPGFNDQDKCAQNCIFGFGFAGVASFLGCDTNACLCRADHLYAGMQFISSCAVATCSNFNDATGGMTVFSAYCAALGSTSVQTPTVLGSSGQGAALTGVGMQTGGGSGPAGTRTVLSLATVTPTIIESTSLITTTDHSGLSVTETIVTGIPVVTETDTQSQLSESDKIALGVGLGMGVPTFLITAWACWKVTPPWRR